MGRNAAGRPTGIVYLCTDGFDADPSEVYRRTLLASMNPRFQQEASQLMAEYAGTVSRARAQAEQALAAKGLRTVVVALGGIHAEFATSAANMGNGVVAEHRRHEHGRAR